MAALAAADAAPAAMDADEEHAGPGVAVLPCAPQPPHPAHPLRSRLSGDVRSRIGLPRTPAPQEAPWRNAPGQAHARTARDCFALARDGTFAPRAAADTDADDPDAALASSLNAAALPPAEVVMAESDGDTPVSAPLSDTPVVNGGDTQTRELVLDAVAELWERCREQCCLIATNPVIDVNGQLVLDAHGRPLNNRLNAGHYNTITARLGPMNRTPLEHAAVVNLLAAALSCPCRSTSNPDKVCGALPCREHTEWAKSPEGNAAWCEAKRHLGLERRGPHTDSVAPWCMNIITESATRLRLTHGFVRSLGADALAAYGPAAFPFGLLTRKDACVDFLRSLSDKVADTPLLRELAAAAAARLAAGDVVSSPAAARDALASDLLHDNSVMGARLNALRVEGLDPAQAGMAAADDRTYCQGDAGPGAGKTRTLVARLAYLYRQGRVAPHRAVMVTFTRKAVEEMEKRVRKAPLPVPRVVTLTSFVPTFLSDVCRTANEPRFVLLAKDKKEASALENEKAPNEAATTLEEYVLRALVERGADAANLLTRQLAKALTDDLQKAIRHKGVYWQGDDQGAVADVAAEALKQGSTGWFDNIKTHASTLSNPLLLAMGGRKFNFRPGNVANLCEVMALVRGYLSALEQRDPANPRHILTGPEAVLLAAALAAMARGSKPSAARQPPPAWASDERLVAAAKAVITRSHPTFYMLDEMQDTDATQFELFAQLAAFGEPAGGARLTAVGDFDQAIYGFRGASPAALQAEIAATFAAHETHLLVRNYRSTPAIVAACRAIIAPNYAEGTGAKALAAVRQQGMPVQLVACSSREDEYQRIAAEVDAWHAAGVALGKGGVGKGDGMAVLFCRNADVAAFAAHMREHWGQRADTQLAECGDENAAAAAPKGALLVSTIHGVKGLEFEIVFLAGLGELVSERQANTRGAGQPKTWVSHAAWVAKSSADCPGAAYAEMRRVLYVAASRPRSLLHVSYAGQLNGVCDAVQHMCEALLPANLAEHLRCGTGDGSSASAAGPRWCSAAQLAAMHQRRTAADLLLAGPPVPAAAAPAAPALPRAGARG